MIRAARIIRFARRARRWATAGIVSSSVVGCATQPVDDEAAEIDIATDAISSRSPADVDVTPGMRWLSSRSERELGEVFANGTAESIPLGANTGMPLLPGRLAALERLAVLLYQGSVWSSERDPDGRPVLAPDGEPIVTLRDKFLRDGSGGLITYFRGSVYRRTIQAVDVGVAPPSGTSPPYALSPYRLPITTDGKPSLFVDYHADPTPFVNRILDEIREVDHDRCPGLYIGRAHFLESRARMRWSYLYYFALDFGPAGHPCNVEET